MFYSTVKSKIVEYTESLQYTGALSNHVKKGCVKSVKIDTIQSDST